MNRLKWLAINVPAWLCVLAILRCLVHDVSASNIVLPSAMELRIEELERRVKELEARPYLGGWSNSDPGICPTPPGGYYQTPWPGAGNIKLVPNTLLHIEHDGRIMAPPPCDHPMNVIPN
jgi:hypothetical protein